MHYCSKQIMNRIPKHILSVIGRKHFVQNKAKISTIYPNFCPKVHLSPSFSLFNQYYIRKVDNVRCFSLYPKRLYHKISSASNEEESNTESTSNDTIENNDLKEEIANFYKEHQVVVSGVPEKLKKPVFDFSTLNLPEKLHSLLKQLNFNKPTPIQAQSLPILLEKNDLIGIAQTGSGKTLAYLLPAFEQFFSIHRNYFSQRDQPHLNKLNPKVLVLAPTRELALQILDVVKMFRIFKTICLYGGSDRNKQIYFLENNNPLIVVSTPGRLKDLIDAKFIDLSEITYLVVDEADRMLDMGFEPQISYLINRCPKERQTMMFSATWPEEVKSLVHKYLRPNHAFLTIGGTKLVANHNIEQNVMVCNVYERNELLESILSKHNQEKMILFSNTKYSCDKLARLLTGQFKTRASPLHGGMTQRQRENTLKAFKDGYTKILCATNVAARGLDIDDVNVVINYDFDDDIETYVHRIGRTGRKNNKGFAYSFFTDHSNGRLAAKLIEILTESQNQVPDELIQISSQNSAPQNKRKQYRSSYNNNNNRYNNESRYNNRYNQYDQDRLYNRNFDDNRRSYNRGGGGDYQNRHNSYKQRNRNDFYDDDY